MSPGAAPHRASDATMSSMYTDSVSVEVLRISYVCRHWLITDDSLPYDADREEYDVD